MKIDSKGLVTGKALYTDDLANNQNYLTIKLLRSPHASGKILEIDTKIAKKVPGVENIFTYLDVPQSKFTLAGQSFPEPSPYDRKILDEYVRYVGDPVAIIAAIDEKTALKAMKLIKVKYEIFEPVLDFENAIDNKNLVHREKAHLNHDISYDNKRNIASQYFQERGDVSCALRESHIILERTYYTQPQIHAMMETYRTSASIDIHGRLDIISSTQVPFHVKRHLARALEISPSKIKVSKPCVGGGFGGKQTCVSEIYPAFVTLKTGKPSKIVFSRKEANVYSTNRHPMRITVKIGANEDGKINGIDLNVLSNTGAYGEHASTVTPLVAFKTFPLYSTIPMRINAQIVYTNTMVSGAFRGYGATQGTFAMESALNELATALNMDPIDLRLKNLQGDIVKCIEKGKELFEWDKRKKEVSIYPNKTLGVGMAVTMQGSGIPEVDTATAMIKLNDSGEFTLYIGVTDMGQGVDTILAQMASEVLETSIDNIIVQRIDTDISPYDPGAYASSGTYVTGNAVILACNKLLEKINIFSRKHNISPKDYKKIGELSIGYCAQEQLIERATWGGNTSPPPHIAGFAQVEVDNLTGECKVLEFLSVVDCGTVINPALARVQVEGGTVQGIGLGLYEDVIFGKKGNPLNDTLMQYKIPARKDIEKLSVHFIDNYEKTGPFGAKSLGEVVINTPAPAIFEGIYQCTKKRLRKLPITPEKILLG